MLGGSDGTVGASPQALPAVEDVRAQLEILLASSDLDAPARARRFLRYVVEETLAGRAERIKAYAIGTEVFERSADFDAQSDPVVRIEARRLRRALERYYLSDGLSDPVVITIPKGAYIPHFAWRTPQAAEFHPVPAAAPPEPPVGSPPRRRTPWLAAAPIAIACLAFLAGLVLWSPWRDGASRTPQVSAPLPPGGPTLVVMPFAALGEPSAGRTYADSLTEEVLSQFARFKEIAVLGRETSRSIPPGADAARIRHNLGVRYVLEGSVRAAAHRLRITGRLLDAETGAVLWSQTYDENLQVRDLFTIQDDVARKVATAVAQPYGIIQRADQTRPEPAPAHPTTSKPTDARCGSTITGPRCRRRAMPRSGPAWSGPSRSIRITRPPGRCCPSCISTRIGSGSIREPGPPRRSNARSRPPAGQSASIRRTCARSRP